MVFDDNVVRCVLGKHSGFWAWVENPNVPLDIEKAIVCMQGGKKRCSGFVRIYELEQTDGKWLSRDIQYMLPNARDSLVSDLSELSLTHTVVGLKTVSYGVCIALVESKDGTTNIDADVIDAIVQRIGK